MVSIMKIYFAPLEGITGYIYRNAYSRCFVKADKYFTPFLTPGGKKGLSARERNDILPQNNEGLYIVPQLLTRNAEDFLKAAGELKEYGYQEVNLNLGCPSGTVVSKGRGAGFLADLNALQRFLDEVFAHTPVAVSLKTRIGLEDASEWEDILQLFNEYPLRELIVHPRLRKDYYNGKPDLEAFAYGMDKSKNPLCYNGDIASVQDYENIKELFPALDVMMIGRGLLRNPFLLGQLRQLDGERETDVQPMTENDDNINSEPMQHQQENKQDESDTFIRFHQELLMGYKEYMSGDTPVLFKMKELWFYMQDLFPEDDKLYKKIKKAKSLAEYESIVRVAFATHKQERAPVF